MTEDSLARRRWFTIVATRIVATAGAVFGLVIAGRAGDWTTKGLGVAIILSAIYMMAVVPRSLARRWRSPPES